MERDHQSAVQWAGIRRTGAGVTLQIDHAHAELEFNLVVSGRGTYFLEDRQHDLRPGALVWLLPHQRHRLIRSADLDMWVVSVPAASCSERLLGLAAQYPARILANDDAIALDRLLTHISQDTDEPSLYRAGIDYAVRSAIHASITSAGPAPKPLHSAVIQALMLLRSGSPPENSTGLAKQCGVTADYLGQLLMEQTGRGIVEWRNRIRLERFHKLYPESRDLLTAALAAGFGSYTQFHRVFAELIGTTPGDWAKNGDRAATVALPSASNLVPGLDDSSSRMIWYSLCETRMPGLKDWFAPGFVDHALSDGPAPDDHPEIASFVESMDQLRQFEGDFVDRLQCDDVAGADRLARAFKRCNVLDNYVGTIGNYGFGLHDLGSLLEVYVGLSWTGANLAPDPGLDHLGQLARRMRRALNISRTFSSACEEERQRFAAAIMAQTVFLANAIGGARASGNERIGSRVSDAAMTTCKAVTGIDPRATRLDFGP
jgi:AraC-like DNA-binding protein